MIISLGRFFSDFHEYTIFCGIAWRQAFQECFEFFTFHYSNCCILRVKTMLNNSETDSDKSGQYQVNLWHYKWLLYITENLLEKILPISQVRTSVITWRTGRMVTNRIRARLVGLQSNMATARPSKSRT